MDTSSNRMGAYASVALLVWFLMAVIGGWMEHSQRAWQNPEVRARAGPAQGDQNNSQQPIRRQHIMTIF